MSRIIFIISFIQSFLFATIINVPNDYSTIQAGINASSDGDTVLAQSGTYVENINFNGKNIVVGSLYLTTSDTSYISSTIIDGNQSGSVVTFDSGEDTTAILSAFTIQNGSAVDGGGIYSEYSNPTLTNLTISGNTALDGGGIYFYNSNATLINVMIKDNAAALIDDPDHGSGGGIYFTSSDATLINVTIMDNTAASGGGIGGGNSNPTLTNVTIKDNAAVGNIGSGGGMMFGGGSNPTLTNVTISGNTSNVGGGISISHSDTTNLTNVTISGNTSNGGGGIYIYEADPTIINSIIWGNEPQPISTQGSFVPIITYSDIEGGYTGIGNINSDPLFADPANDNYTLQLGSPAIDAGDPDLDGDGSDYTTDTDDQDPDGTRMDMGAYYFYQNDTIPPTVQLLSPAMNTELTIGEVTQITWSADDNYSVDHLNIEYMTDVLSWTVIEENEVDDGEYDWLVPNTPSSVVSLRILAFDPGGNSDTAHVENLSIIVPVVPAPIVSGMYPSNHIAWHEGVFHVIFSQEMDPNTIYMQNNVNIHSNLYGDLSPGIHYYIFYGDNSTVQGSGYLYVFFEQTVTALDTLTLTLSSLRNNSGVELDGDLDGVPGGDYSYTYHVYMLADYDMTGTIDALDLATFVEILDSDEYSHWSHELGPVIGTVPHFRMYRDSLIDIEDVMTFVMMWNWYVTNNDGLLGQLADFGEPIDIEATHDSLYFDLPPGILAYEVQVQHNPEIISFGTVESNSTVKLQSTDKEVGLFNLINAPNEQTHVSIPINMSGKEADITFVIRAIGHDNTIISQQTSKMTVLNIPEQFALHHNYPNPFNPVTTIQYDIPVDAEVILVVYDIVGRHVKTLIHANQTAGYKSIRWNGMNDLGQSVSAGMYFYHLQAIGYSKVRKMVLLK